MNGFIVTVVGLTIIAEIMHHFINPRL